MPNQCEKSQIKLPSTECLKLKTNSMLRLTPEMILGFFQVNSIYPDQ